MRLKRETVQKFWCPVCRAGNGQPCTIESTGKIRPQLHRARVQKAEMLISASLREQGKPAA
jgi:hypothetical protein